MLPYGKITETTLAAALVLLLSACGEPPPQATDADLQATFERHFEEFSRVVGMVEHDHPQILWIKTHEMQPADASLPEERWQEYSEACDRIGVRSIERQKGRVQFYSTSDCGGFGHGLIKGFLFSSGTPGPLLESLDAGVPPALLKGGTGSAYRSLGSNWYLFARQD